MDGTGVGTMEQAMQSKWGITQQGSVGGGVAIAPSRSSLMRSDGVRIIASRRPQTTAPKPFPIIRDREHLFSGIFLQDAETRG